MTVLPWGMYEYNYLPMGLKIVTDVVQSELASVFEDLQSVQIYLDDIIVFGVSMYEDHLQMVNTVLIQLRAKTLQVNARKSHWACDEVEY